MKAPGRPPNEALRLEALRQFELLDTAPEAALDELTALAAHLCNVPISQITLIDDERAWVKSTYGLSAGESARAVSFCAHAILHPGLLMVPDALLDARFSDNPHVTGAPHIRFYAGAPLMSPEGHALGTLCVVDRVPRTLTPVHEEALQILARQVMSHLERRRQARELSRRERLLAAILDSEPECLKMLDRDGALRMMNPAGLAMIEADSFEQVEGANISQVLVPEHRTAFLALTERVFRGESGVLEFRVVGLKGGSRWLETHAGPLRDESGAVVSLLGITRDITAQKAAAEALRDSEERYRTLVETSPEALCVIQDGRLVYVNPAATALFRAESPDALLDTPILDHVHPARRSMAQSRMDEVLGGGAHVRVPSVWLRLDGAPIDVEVFSRPIMHLGRPAIQATIRDVTEKKRAEQELRDSEARYRALIHWSPHALCIAQEGVVVFANPAALRVFAASSPADLLGRPVLSLVAPTDQALAAELMGTILEQGVDVLDYELEMARLDGSVVPMVGSGTAVMYDGWPALQFTVVDVSPLKRAIAQLQASNERFELVARATTDAIWDWDLDANTIWWNDYYRSEFGYALGAGGLTTESWAELLHPEDAQRVQDGVAAALASRSSVWESEYRYRREDGSYANVFNRGVIVRDIGGRPTRFLGAMQDVSESRSAVAAMELQAERLALATEAGAIGIWDWDVVTDRWFGSPTYASMLGHAPDGEGIDFGHSLERVHPDDRSGILAQMAGVLAGDTTPYQYEARFLHADGEYRWMKVVGRVLEWDEEGKPRRLLGARTDITESRRAAEPASGNCSGSTNC